MSEEYNWNPTRRNQYPGRRKLLFFFSQFPFLKHFISTVQADDLVLKAAMQKYHNEGKSKKTEISERLFAEYNITLRYDHCSVLIYYFLFIMVIVLDQSSGDIGTLICMVVRSQPMRCLIKRGAINHRRISTRTSLCTGALIIS